MRTVYIIVEGQTEEEFVNNSLSHYLKDFGIINTVPILLETSPGFYGGDLTFSRYSRYAQNLLISDPNAIITSLIDYYQLRNDFPGYAHSFTISDKNLRVAYLEEQMLLNINDSRFIPYIQLHEFEGVLFSDIKGFDYIPNIKPTKKTEIEKIIYDYPNPELINDGATTAPSKRLMSLISRYKKTFHGPIIALGNGMTPVLDKCPRFKNWIELIITKANN
jgi:hypothetical protein